jgi:hypothetical protein
LPERKPAFENKNEIGNKGNGINPPKEIKPGPKNRMEIKE